MASKKGVVMYYDILDQLEDFTDEQFGKITRAIIKYDKTGQITEFDDLSMKVAFKMLKPILDRNKQEYAEICEKRREAGSLGGKQKVANASKCYQMLANDSKSTYNDNDIDKDIDKDKVKDKVKEIIKEIESESLRVEIQEFVKMRTRIKKPLTAHALDLILRELNRLTPNIDEQVLIVQQSIKNGWQGVFPLKEDKKQDSFEKFKELAQNYNYGE